MKGVVKLKVPPIEVTPNLYIITLSFNGKQVRFNKVALSLDKAIRQCYHEGHIANFNNYITHTELSVLQINILFKNFNPNN